MNRVETTEALKQLRQELLNGEMTAYKEYYESYRAGYVRFASRYTDDKDMILDSYQDAFIALYENVTEGKITEIKSSLKTYVFSIAKYSLFAKLRKKGKEVETEDLSDLAIQDESVKNAFGEEQYLEVKNALGELGEKCREVLVLFYYRGFTIDAIMREMGYKNENTTKVHKSRCLKKLSEIVHQEAK